MQGQTISKLDCKSVSKIDFAERDRIFVIEVSYESPEKNKQDGIKFISVIQHFHIDLYIFFR